MAIHSNFPPSPLAGSKDGKKARILIVDDQEIVRTITAVILERMGGHSPIVSAHGREALSVFRKGGIDLLISDYEMPGMSGLALLKEIRSLDRRAKVIIQSGGRSQEEVGELLREGALKVLLKPVKPKELLAAVSCALEFDAFKPGPEGIVRPVRVLLADDERGMRIAAREACLALGHEPLLACDGADALRIFIEMGADVVVSDLHMPRIGGMELLSEMRRNGSGTPFILATGESRQEVLGRALEAGATLILEKPYSIEELGDAIARAMKGKNGL